MPKENFSPPGSFRALGGFFVNSVISRDEVLQILFHG
jgi:hypothetical protein